MRIGRRALLCATLAVMAALPAGAKADEILVSGAASLTDAMKEIGTAFMQQNRQTTVRYNFGASGALLQQIEQGAPTDVFASAAPKEMDTLQTENKIDVATRIDFAGNKLALIAPLSSKLKRWEDLASPAVRRVAIGNPASVPAGRYAQEVLTHRHLWAIVQPKAIMGQNVRQTLAYVVNGDVEAGVVFATDAYVEKSHVRIVQTAIPGKDHAPIVYPAAVLRDAPNAPVARRFVAFLSGRTAQRILRRYGFTPPAQKGK